MKIIGKSLFGQLNDIRFYFDDSITLMRIVHQLLDKLRQYKINFDKNI